MKDSIKAYIINKQGIAKVYDLYSVKDLIKLDYECYKTYERVTFLYKDNLLKVNDDLDFIENEEIIKNMINKIDRKEEI